MMTRKRVLLFCTFVALCLLGGRSAEASHLVQKKLFDEEDITITEFTKSVAHEYWGEDKDIFSKTYGIMVMPTSAGRIMFVCDPRWERVCWMVQGSADIYEFGSGLKNPYDIAGRFPYIFICDPGNNRVVRYKIVINDDNVSITEQTFIGTGTLEWPYGVDYSDNGTPSNSADDVIYVAEAYHRRICKFKINGTLVSSFGEQRIDIRDFCLPTDVAVGYDYEAGSNTRDIFVLDANVRKRVVTYCDTPRASSEFYFLRYDSLWNCDLTSIATDCYGCPYVSDATNDRIIKLYPDLSDTLWTYGTGFNEIHDIYILEDELFAAEKWTSSSGISYYSLELEDIPPDTLPPVVEIIWPGDGDCVAGDKIIGTVIDNERYVKYWQLFYREEADPCSTFLIDFGTKDIEAGSLTTWSTVGLDQGVYTLLLEGVDGAGNKGWDSVRVWVGFDHEGENWSIASDVTICGCHGNIDAFTVSQNITASVLKYDSSLDSLIDTTGWLCVKANSISIQGNLLADSSGYAAREGPGGGADGSPYYGSGGGGHCGRGGHGGWGLPGDTVQFGGYAYGSAESCKMGSGGGDVLDPDGGAGGGIIKLLSSSTTAIAGKVSSAGNCGTGSGENAAGGGAGGCVRIRTDSLSGTGLIAVKGGDGANGVSTDGGGGAGGGICITYTSSSFHGRIDVSGGVGHDHAIDGQAGIALVQRADSSVSLLISPVHAGTNPDSKEGFIKGVEFTNAWVRLSANDSIIGNTEISASDSIVISSGSYILANKKGYGHNEGTGRGHYGKVPTIPKAGGGAGYGGVGGHGRFYVSGGLGDGGVVYGDSIHPDNLGSGGGDWDTTSGHHWGGGSGGGRIKLECFDGSISLNGMVSANGGNGSWKSSWAGGGGSGGSILVYAGSLEGTGTVNAKGGNGASSTLISNGGGGAGGRVALHRDDNSFSGTVSVAGGLKGGTGATNGAIGTIYTDTLLQGRGPQDDNQVVASPFVFKLCQNKPNPFVGMTVIRYSVPKKTKVSLRVYDVTGRCVKTLVNSERKPGYHEVKLESKDLGPGIYFSKFIAGDYEQVKKLILMH